MSRPENSIIHQSRDASYHPGVSDPKHLRNIVVNGDGFGVAWYSDTIKGPCVFRFITPAWSNENLRNICNHVSAPVIFAHVRAAANGRCPIELMKSIISTENCHPFKFKRYCMEHNGGICRFEKIKKRLVSVLPDDVYENIKGTTDSEYIFALLLSLIPSFERQLSMEELADVVTRTISLLRLMCIEAGVDDAMSLNLLVSDGVHTVATRYRCTHCHDLPPSLYYCFGSLFGCDTQRSFSCMQGSVPNEIVIASAPLSHITDPDLITDAEPHVVKDRYGTWVLIPPNQMLLCEGDPEDISKVRSVRLLPILLVSTASDDSKPKMITPPCTPIAVPVSPIVSDLTALHETPTYPPRCSSKKLGFVAVHMPSFIAGIVMVVVILLANRLGGHIILS
jgi:glutamine amidotransferase